MKYIKVFREPKVGDYVACEENLLFSSEDDLSNHNFISNNIGRITKIEEEGPYRDSYKDKVYIAYIVEYDNVPKDKKYNILYFKNLFFSLREIKFWSKNKEDVEEYLTAKKYNL